MLDHTHKQSKETDRPVHCMSVLKMLMPPYLGINCTDTSFTSQPDVYDPISSVPTEEEPKQPGGSGSKQRY